MKRPKMIWLLKENYKVWFSFKATKKIMTIFKPNVHNQKKHHSNEN